MEQFRFSLSVILAGLFYKKELSFITLLSLILTFFLPIIALSSVIDSIDSLAVFSSPYIEDTTYVSINHRYIPEDEMIQLLFSMDDNAEQVYFSNSYNCVVSYSERKQAAYVIGFSNNFFEFDNYKLTKGRMPTDEELITNANICLLSKSASLLYPGLQINDTITISGMPYTVIGVVASNSSGQIMVPYTTLEIFLSDKETQYYTFIQTKNDNGDNVQVIKNTLNRNGIKYTQVIPAEEIYDMVSTNIQLHIFRVVAAAMTVLVFSIISFVLIMVGKMMESKYLIGIKLALGATKANIFFDHFFETVILIEIAILINCILIPILNPLITRYISIQLDYRVYIMALLLGLLIGILVTTISIMIFVKKSVAEIIKGKI